MNITVIIECTTLGSIAGYQEQRAYHTDTVGSLIENYCAFKGIRRDPAYVLIARDNILRESMKTLAEAGVKDGDHLFLVKRANSSDVGASRLWILCGIALTIGIVGLLTITILYASPAEPPFDYGIVFDAGSTHTNMYLYTWQGDKANGTGVVRQIDECVVEGGGIAEDFRDSPKDVASYLNACLGKGITKIPDDERASSPVYLAATAGMRLLGAEDPEAEQEILGNVSLLFRSSPLKLEDRGVRTICGEEEALSGWITVNYLSSTLEVDRRLFRPKRETFTVKTIGALDLGGASTQITFEIPPPDSLVNITSDCGDDIKTLKLYGKSYYLYSKSFLCFGVKEFKKMYRTLLLKGIPKANITDAVKNVSSPCDNVGYSFTTNYGEIISFCSNTTLPDELRKLVITFTGTGNFTECQSRIEYILNETNCQQIFTSRSCLKQVPPRNYSAVFGAFSSFAYLTRGLNITPSMGASGFYNASKGVCEMTWNQVQEHNFPGILPKYQPNMCFESLYQYSLLKKQYMLSEEEWKKLSFSLTIDGTDVGWSLGFMINSTNIIPAEAPISSFLSLTGFIILGMFFAFFVSVAAVLATLALKKSRTAATRPLGVNSPSLDESRQRLTYGTIDA